MCMGKSVPTPIASLRMEVVIAFLLYARRCGQSSASSSTTTTTTASSSSSSGDAARTGSSGEGNGSSRVDNTRKADGEHLEDLEREDGKWRTEGNQRKTVEEDEEGV